MGYEISGQVGLVTGANRGIGKAILEALLKAGAAKVYAAVRDPASVSGLTEAYGDKVVPLELDLTKPETIKTAAQTAGQDEKGGEFTIERAPEGPRVQARENGRKKRHKDFHAKPSNRHDAKRKRKA